MRIDLQPAWVLHRRSYRDSSLLLEAFSREHGRLALVARGAQNPKARLSGLLQPFRPLLLSWSGRGEVYSLRAAEESGAAFLLPAARVLSGLYLNELLLKLLTRHDPHPALFLAYQNTLAALAGEEREEISLRRFESLMLSELGYALALTTEADTGHPVNADKRYAYDPVRGPIGSNGHDGLLVSGKSLLALANGDFSDREVLRDSKRLLRAALAVHLEGKPLKTRELAAVYRVQARSNRA